MSLFDQKAVLEQANKVLNQKKESNHPMDFLEKIPKEKKWEEMSEEERGELKEQKAKEAVAMRFNQNKLEWSLVDFQSLESMVKVLEFGKKKYARNNWQKGLVPREILESMLRHIFALLEGERYDLDSNLPHIGHIMCNAMFYSYFTEVHPEKAAKEKD